MRPLAEQPVRNLGLSLIDKRYKLSSHDERPLMIQSFACNDTRDLYQGRRVAKFANIEIPATRKLAMLAAATSLADLRIPPGNRLHALTGDRAGQHSISINAQWRICFQWTEAGPIDVEIVDYH